MHQTSESISGILTEDAAYLRQQDSQKTAKDCLTLIQAF